MIRLELPYPPSVNGIFGKFNGAKLSEKYRKWRDEAGWLLRAQNPKRLSGAVSVAVMLVPPDKRVRDLDNAGFKACIDLLVRHELIEGDDWRYVKRIAAEWSEDGPPCVVTVEPYTSMTSR